MIYSRARFEAGEVDVLRDTFNAKASSTHTTEKNEEEKVVEKEVLFDLVKSLPGYEAIKVKDFNYVLEETGYTRAENVDFDAFVEVCALGLLFLHTNDVTDNTRLVDLCGAQRSHLCTKIGESQVGKVENTC